MGYGVIPPVIPLTMLFDHDRAKGIRRTNMPQIPPTPIVVTENAADEEFREFEYRILAAPTSSMVGTDYSSYVIGSRIGPHYFKRIGPPSHPDDALQVGIRPMRILAATVIPLRAFEGDQTAGRHRSDRRMARADFRPR